MFTVPAILNSDAYKQAHYAQYSPHTEKVYSTWTPRKSRMEGVDKVIFFGLQYFIKDYLIESFNKTFFNRPKEEVISEFKRIASKFGFNDVSHFEALHDLGYLPLKICAIPEGTLTPIRVPMFTIENTKPEFYWLTNFVETIMSTEIWKPMTSATIALQYRKICEKWAEKTCDNKDHIPFQGHDFSYRGMCGTDAGCSSGAGHLLSFRGTDTIPAVMWLEKYYNANVEKELVGTSIPATEHAVAETNIIEIQQQIEKERRFLEMSEFVGFMDDQKEAELRYFERLLNVYPSGIFSYVADTYNLWDVLTDILPWHKNRIMSRDGKVVIRPDSGDPCDIICGLNSNDEYTWSNGKLMSAYDADGMGKLYEPLKNQDYAEQRYKGVIELLWETFGGTVNSKGYKVLDLHIGCIYGDAITIERAEEICRRLEQKGFASSNIVFGIGSYTYNMNTRDTFGFALKATYGVVNGKELLLYKDPITDDGTKKSQKGMVSVFRDERFDEIMFRDNLYQKDREDSYAMASAHSNDSEHYEMLLPVFEDGKILKEYSLQEIRQKIDNEIGMV